MRCSAHGNTGDGPKVARIRGSLIAADGAVDEGQVAIVASTVVRCGKTDSEYSCRGRIIQNAKCNGWS